MTREEFYEKVWQTPMTKLAAHYGLSDNGLRKICRNLQIPTPYTGYWAKKNEGIDNDDWKDWALAQADRLDPLKESPHSILDEEGEFRPNRYYW
jgi:hypothetical protein